VLFRRRKPDSFYQRLRLWVWPRRSFQRSLQYMSKRVLRLTGSPHAIAAGVAAGTFTSMTPFLGFHILAAACIAYVIGGNLVASTIATGFANPLTFPFIWGSTLAVGRFILYGSFEAPEHLHIGHMLTHLRFAELWDPLLKPMAIGSIPVGLLVAGIMYAITYSAASAFREQRRKRLAERARRKADARISHGLAAE
jgi:uncharacterized protein (DUF2062 family)